MKNLTKLVVAAAAILAVAGCKKQDAPKADTSLDDLLSRGVFVLGLDDSLPPLGFRSESNEIVGYDIDLAKEVARRLGVEFKAQKSEKKRLHLQSRILTTSKCLLSEATAALQNFQTWREKRLRCKAVRARKKR